ncbi:hypothetical protein ACFH04_05820 [Streptomyces noboritoensis]|uniref:Uncharacterized protein n=1 Tax=Streptomyces noboritoensis TaxID=67337 RepID=A0ABV6TBT8_9ACTN
MASGFAETSHRQRRRSVTRVLAASRVTGTAAQAGQASHEEITAAASWSSTSRIVTQPGTAMITLALSPPSGEKSRKADQGHYGHGGKQP